MEEILKCKFCGKTPQVNDVKPDGSMHNGWFSIQCNNCNISVSTSPNDVVSLNEYKGQNGWDVICNRLPICKNKSIEIWNAINAL